MISRGKVHQSRLYYLRDLSGKAARIKERERDTSSHAEAVEAAPAEGAAAEGAEGEAAAAAPAAAPKAKKPRKAKK